MGQGTNQIATKADANGIHATSGWANNKKCPTKQELTTAGFTVSGSYPNTKLVKYSHISYSNPNYITADSRPATFYTNYYSIHLYSGSALQVIDHNNGNVVSMLGSGSVNLVSASVPSSWPSEDPINLYYNASGYLNFDIRFIMDGYSSSYCIPINVNNFYITYNFKNSGQIYQQGWNRSQMLDNQGILTKSFSLSRFNVSYIEVTVNFNS